jgi:hypothetical protein
VTHPMLLSRRGTHRTSCVQILIVLAAMVLSSRAYASVGPLTGFAEDDILLPARAMVPTSTAKVVTQVYVKMAKADAGGIGLSEDFFSLARQDQAMREYRASSAKKLVKVSKASTAALLEALKTRFGADNEKIMGKSVELQGQISDIQYTAQIDTVVKLVIDVSYANVPAAEMERVRKVVTTIPELYGDQMNVTLDIIQHLGMTSPPMPDTRTARLELSADDTRLLARMLGRQLQTVVSIADDGGPPLQEVAEHLEALRATLLRSVDTLSETTGDSGM